MGRLIALSPATALIIAVIVQGKFDRQDTLSATYSIFINKNNPLTL